MTLYKTQQALQKALHPLKTTSKTLGFVPTMGALHKGHMSLVNKALEETDLIVVSIFVNPTQFGDRRDLIGYPRTLSADLALLESRSKTRILVYAPKIKDIYPAGTTVETFDFEGLETHMEGQFRPGHFDAVGTIVKHLFAIVKPDKAYFGEKDFQQLAIIKKMVKKLQIPVTIVPCKIARELDGLAMSSRNQRLTTEQRAVAPYIYEVLETAKTHFGTKSATKVISWVKKQFENHQHLTLEYFIIADQNSLKPIIRKSKHRQYRAFIAVHAGVVRLIDNIPLN